MSTLGFNKRDSDWLVEIGDRIIGLITKGKGGWTFQWGGFSHYAEGRKARRKASFPASFSHKTLKGVKKAVGDFLSGDVLESYALVIAMSEDPRPPSGG